MITTIQIDSIVKEKLDLLKIHHRESYNELIQRLVELSSPKGYSRESLVETIETLSDPQEMREIAESIEEINLGKRGKTLEQLRKELKI